MNFYERVYALVETIPAGKIMTYGAVALALGRPRAARAVGYALNALPYETPIPWHRVLGRRGPYAVISIHNFKYSSAEQRQRLEAEGVTFDAEGRLALAVYLWETALIPPHLTD
jgi:methylated-DNA-protein-cysteine methyltransferase-like protein